MAKYKGRPKTKGKKSVSELFYSGKQKSASDNKLIKDMIDTVDGMLKIEAGRVAIIDEYWHLHRGSWPEMDERLNGDRAPFSEMDSNGREFNANSFIYHHPKINNVTNYIMGAIIEQPLVPVVRDYSAHGRRARQDAMAAKLREYYQMNIYQPMVEAIQQQYMAENGIGDPMQLNPDEQQQVMADLNRRIDAGIPRDVTDGMQKVKTNDELIKRILLDFDMVNIGIPEKFIEGGEQAVVSYEEYYRIRKEGIKPKLDVLNSKWVSWAASEEVDFCEDGSMAKYEQYSNIHDFVLKYGYEMAKNKDLFKGFKEMFSEIPGRGGKNGIENDTFLREADLDFTDMIGENPGLITEDWRTLEGQAQIAAIYQNLRAHRFQGGAIREVYTTFKWTEAISYVLRRGPDGKLQEFFFSGEYKKNPVLDVYNAKFPINRVYHGTKVADSFYVDIGPVPWQYYGGHGDFDSKLTICGRRYSKDGGSNNDSSLIGPAVPYQLRYNLSASKLEMLEKSDKGKFFFWNLKMKPAGWDEEDYMEAISMGGNVPYTDDQIGQKGGTPVHEVDGGISSKLNEYRASMDMWETEIYKAMNVNRDALGAPDRYQSNALTQSNIRGSEKQMYMFHNKRRQLKQRVLNYFSNLSLLCLIDDKEKQAALLDDFSALHLELNEKSLRANMTTIFIVDDYNEAQNLDFIKQYLLQMLQHGGSANDVIRLINAKSIQEMEAIAEDIESKIAQANKEASISSEEAEQRAEQMRRDWEEFKAGLELQGDLRKSEVQLEIANIRADFMRRATDINEDGIADSVERANLEIASKEKIEKEKREVEREEIAAKREAARIKNERRGS